jgi:hypothetical protein
LTIIIIDIPRFIHRLGKFIYFLKMAFNATQITDLKFDTYLAAGSSYRSRNRCNNIGPAWENVYCH